MKNYRGDRKKLIYIQVKKALTVTQNKLGDLLYRTGSVERARDMYQEALTARQSIAAACNGDEKLVAELDVAFSFAKAADIEQASAHCSPSRLNFSRKTCRIWSILVTHASSMQRLVFSEFVSVVLCPMED